MAVIDVNIFLKGNFCTIFDAMLTFTAENAFARNSMVGVGRRRWQAGGHFPRHTHKGYGEIMLVLEGSLIHRLNRSIINMRRNDLVFVREGDTHEISAGEAGCHYVNFAVPLATVCFLRERYCGSDSSAPFSGTLCDPGHEPEKLSLPAAVTAHLGQVAADLEYRASQLEIEAWLLQASSAAIRQCRGRLPGVSPKIPVWLSEAVFRAEEASRQRPVDIAELVRFSGRSHEHLARVMRETMGTTPSRFLRGLRVDQAASLLVNGDLPVLDIAYTCGFESIGHFYRVFREEKGVSPARFRRNQRF